MGFSSSKAVALRDVLESELKQRLSTFKFLKGTNSDDHPTLRVSADDSPATGEEGFWIRVRPLDWPEAEDSLGNTARMYSPHVIQIVVEDAASTESFGVNKYKTILSVVGTALLKGTRVEVYERAAGAFPADADITSANLKTTFDPHVQYPMAGV